MIHKNINSYWLLFFFSICCFVLTEQYTFSNTENYSGILNHIVWSSIRQIHYNSACYLYLESTTVVSGRLPPWVHVGQLNSVTSLIEIILTHVLEPTEIYIGINFLIYPDSWLGNGDVQISDRGFSVTYNCVLCTYFIFLQDRWIGMVYDIPNLF